MTLDKYLQKVIDQQSFLEFVHALKADKENEQKKEQQNPSNPYGSGWNDWENSTIEGFLDSAIVWAEASNFGDIFNGDENLWKKFALFLYSGKFYE